MESASLSARKKEFSPARRWIFSPSFSTHPSMIFAPIGLTYATVPSSFNATMPARKLDRIAFSRFIFSSNRYCPCKGILLDEDGYGNSEGKRGAGREIGFHSRHGH